VLLNLLDDATRFNVAARLYRAETLLAHLDLLERAFRTYGLPLALYVYELYDAYDTAERINRCEIVRDWLD